MASEVLMPRQGNTVESCIILSWKKGEGDSVQQGEVLCEVETDKATFEVESPAKGILLKVLYPEGADVPVLELIAIVGESKEDISALLEKRGAGDSVSGGAPEATEERSSDLPSETPDEAMASVSNAEAVSASVGVSSAISPRAKNLATAKGVSVNGIAGSGPGGRIIERDVQKVLGGSFELTPAAIALLKSDGGNVPARGTGLGGRITTQDVTDAGTPTAPAATANAVVVGAFPGPTSEVSVQGIRRRVAERMVASLQNTAQVSLFMPADATELRAYRARLKSSNERSDLSGINFNDMVLYAVSRTLVVYPEMNAHYLGDRIVRFERVHLGFAVDTPRGLVVPVIKNADLLSLKEISSEAKRLASLCLDGKISSGELTGGTFTVSNLGALGIEYFTPVLNPPQVGIVGVGSILPRPVERNGGYEIVPHLMLSLTADHQAVDGAPAARFLRSLVANVAAFDLLLAE